METIDLTDTWVGSAPIASAPPPEYDSVSDILPIISFIVSFFDVLRFGCQTYIYHLYIKALRSFICAIAGENMEF